MAKPITKEMEINAEILSELIRLRKIKDETKQKKDQTNYDKYFVVALNKFSYIVDLHTNRYKKFANYKDLHEEGMIGLIVALNNFNPERSKNFFRIANWYIKTRVKRCANKFDVINVPMNIARESAMKRVADFPVIMDDGMIPDEEVDRIQVIKNIQSALNHLSDMHAQVVCLYYGINRNGQSYKKQSIASIAKEMNLSRANVEQLLHEAYDALLLNSKVFNIEL